MPVTMLNVRSEPMLIGQVSATSWITNVVDPHSSVVSLASAATLGMPVAAPALSTQPVIGDTSGLNNALPPIIATAFAQASIRPFLDSVGSSLLSQVRTSS